MPTGSEGVRFRGKTRLGLISSQAGNDGKGPTMKILILVVGVLCVLLGLHWFGQGTLLFPWPSNPAMDGHSEFVVYGIVTACIGAAIIWYAQRRL